MVEEINNHFYSGRTLTPDELEIMRFVRDKNQLERYISQPDGSYKCRCGKIILAVHVIYPILDELLPIIGIDNHLCEEVPYCPNCEERPKSYGPLIDPRNHPKGRN
ncbi:MAG TPA: hypothetical protein ENI19_02240 [Candidatus Nealsonbacteria bacterium]|uniref:Uncharacterized protein n=1 Tax=marine sediment metagenome TaxID=412755 RepID=A0A0F9XTH4_9ZZZZ|nr:hypothetical protein [Candidatus Nealsonbacteria bacterium]HEB46507.1 hypothetical protein [Candidatus Nealsonbacteria bacterium]